MTDNATGDHIFKKEDLSLHVGIGKIPVSTVAKCPVCRGNGLVDNGFYLQTSGCWTSTDATPETCRSCKGKGYVVV